MLYRTYDVPVPHVLLTFIPYSDVFFQAFSSFLLATLMDSPACRPIILLLNGQTTQRRAPQFGDGRGGLGFGGGSEPPVDPNNTNLFVGNLPKDGSVTKQDIREAFVTSGSKVADIVEVKNVSRWGWGEYLKKLYLLTLTLVIAPMT